jgi:hypothetical protein
LGINHREETAASKLTGKILAENSWWKNIAKIIAKYWIAKYLTVPVENVLTIQTVPAILYIDGTVKYIEGGNNYG